ncbi:MAG: hypothetical protein H7X95_08970 [Deltaproteobacteria bacterium]|nr:hypothetical protein [Deltaproteobacteria bacterium]
MSTRVTFPLTLLRRALLRAVPLLLAIPLCLAAPAQARADEMMLTGPHPFLKENALSLQFLLGSGLGTSFSGRGVGLGYGYMLNGPLWLDLQMNVRAAACSPVVSCGAANGSDVELLAGASWRMRTAVPLVPYLRGGAGLIFLYPRTGANAMGLAARGGAGAKYYLFDWLGLGIEAALSLGHGYFDQSYQASHTYAVFDVALGMEWQFP